MVKKASKQVNDSFESLGVSGSNETIVSVEDGDQYANLAQKDAIEE